MKQVSDESSDKTSKAKAAASAIPVVNGKARTKITAIFFMAISRKLIRVMALAFTFLHERIGCCQNLT